MSFIGDIFGGKKKEKSTQTIQRLPPISFGISTGSSSITAGRPAVRSAAPTISGGFQPVAPVSAAPQYWGTVGWRAFAPTGGSPIPPILETPGNTQSVDVSLDPSIQTLRNRLFGQNQDTLRQLEDERSALSQLLSRFRGNANEFVQARVSPLERVLDAQIAGVARDFARRNVTGSIPAGFLTGLRADAERQISEERARAVQDALGAEQSILAQRAGLAAPRTQAISQGAQLAQQQLAEELSALGLGQEAIRTIIASQLPQSTTGSGTSSDPAGGLGGLLLGIGSILEAI